MAEARGLMFCLPEVRPVVQCKGCAARKNPTRQRDVKYGVNYWSCLVRFVSGLVWDLRILFALATAHIPVMLKGFMLGRYACQYVPLL